MTEQGKESSVMDPDLAAIILFLNKHRIRATYGAVAEALGALPQSVGARLGPRRPEVSWIVNAESGLPTGYSAEELHPELQRSAEILRSGSQLQGRMTQDSSAAMDDQDTRLIPLLEQMRDLLAEDVRLRQVAMDDQRIFQQRAQQSIDAAARKQQRSWIITILVLLLVWFGSSFVLPLLLGFGSLVGARGNPSAVVPSTVDTSFFDGTYSLLEDRSFQRARERVLAESDPQRRMTGQKLITWQADQYKNFTVRRGVIRSGVVLVQEFSLRDATRNGSTLTGRAVWHEDIHDPGDASEETISMKLEADVLEFAMLDEHGVALDPVFLKRNGNAR